VSFIHALAFGVFMGKFPLADAEISKVWICRKCKGKNKAGSEKCRRCGYGALRPKKKDVRNKGK